MTQYLKLLVLMGLQVSLISMTPVYAQDQRLDLEGTQIIGNKELPKVLYIVPWQAADKIDISVPPITSILDRPLTSVDRKTFRRQVIYHRALFADTSEEPEL